MSAVYKKPTLYLKTHRDWKWEDGKKYSMQAKESWSSYPHIRQNRPKIKKITRDKEGHYMIKGSIQEEDIAIVNIYAPNIRAPPYIRQTLSDIKGEIDSNTIIVGVFNIPLTPVERSSIRKLIKKSNS